MRKFILFLLLAVILSPVLLHAQIDFGNLEEEQIYKRENKYNTWSLTLGYGPVIYYTDVINYTFLPKDNWKFGPSIQLAKQFGRSWAIESQFIMADMYGTKYQRYFEGNFRELSVNVNAYLNQLIMNGPMRDRWNIYGKIGLGVNAFRSAQKSLGDGTLDQGDVLWVNYIYNIPSGYPTSYADWDPNDYLVMGYKRDNPNLEKTSRQTELIVPIGAGVRYRVNKSFDLGAEVTLRNLVSDNFDVDMTGADNDSYMHATFSLTYKIGRKNKRHSSWTYKDFNLAYDRQRARDPMVMKLDSLRQQLDYLAANDSVVNDTTYIRIDETQRFENYSASVFFDFDKSIITPASQRTIAGVARFMRDNPELRILVQGYTDDRGSYEYNLKLSDRRCTSVIDILVKDFGIDPSRFEKETKGKAELLSDTRKLAPRGVHLVNRRVDIFPIIE
jgi:outer membrane protein OmpA-like peptidoglycan-associated protein